MTSHTSSTSQWNSLSTSAQLLILTFAGSPVWKLYGFTVPDPELLQSAVAAAWNRAGFIEADLSEPERVFPRIKELLRESLRAN